MVFFYDEVLDSRRLPAAVAVNCVNTNDMQIDYDYIQRGTAGFQTCPNEILSSPQQVADFCEKTLHLSKMVEEHVFVLCIRGTYVTGFFEVSHGSLNASLVVPRDLFRKVLAVGATDFIVVHNHPSGSVSPSADDRQTERKLNECAKLLEVHMVDFLISGADTYYSFCEQGGLA